MKTYKVCVKCMNCFRHKEFDIPIRQKVQSFLRYLICDNCECKMGWAN